MPFRFIKIYLMYTHLRQASSLAESGRMNELVNIEADRLFSEPTWQQRAVGMTLIPVC